MTGCVVIVTIASSLDDLFVDACFWLRMAWRRWHGLPAWQTHVLPPDLGLLPAQPIAIIIPAWQEAAVIGRMIAQTVSTLRYHRYDIFIGTYCNDALTQAEVIQLQKRYRHLHHVVVPHAGPTCKADCLNWVIRAVLDHEKSTHVTYAGIVQHDCEDILHPLELAAFNALLPDHDMIQLPVRPLRRQWHQLISSTYIDEFAEWHTKDLVVREMLCGSVPSAGVGTCFSRRAILALIRENQTVPFNTSTLTEDYDIGARLSSLGLDTTFALTHVPYPDPVHTARLRQLPLCVQEYFPETFTAACRQKARWVTGIAFQGWQQIGWRGTLAQRYMLLRDRKGIITAWVNAIALLLMAQFILLQVVHYAGWWHYAPPAFLSTSHWIGSATLGVTVVLVVRITQRALLVGRLYGIKEAGLSFLRVIPGSLLNLAAAARAWRMFITHLRTRQPIAWDKTQHDYPDFSPFAPAYLRLGELLVSWRTITAHQQAAALLLSQQRGIPLGQTLLELGWIDMDTLEDALSVQKERKSQVDIVKADIV